MQLEHLLKGFSEFQIKVSKAISENITYKPHWYIDHVCYRTATQARFEALKSNLQECANLLISSEVNGREIATFQLERGVEIFGVMVDILELPAPKEGVDYQEGFEHVEIVVDESFEVFQKQHPQLQYKPSKTKKDFNPELSILFDSFSIKLHHLSLESVIRLEKQSFVYKAIQDSLVLSHLKPYLPQVIGTYPLGIQVSKSDIDIACQYQDKKEIINTLEENFSDYSDFCIDTQDTSLVCQFQYNKVNFEIFCENKEVFQQRGYLHFNLEERLLKALGPSFYQKIIKLRQEGLKTEPAFARALSLDEIDPYTSLLKIYGLSISDLQARYQQYI